MNDEIKAVIFDLGGVLVPSPVKMILDYGRNKGLHHSTFVETIVNCAEHSAWARWERGEISMEHFGREFTNECRKKSGLDVDLSDFPHLLEREYTSPVYRLYPQLQTAIRRLRQVGYKTAILTNNVLMSDGSPIQPVDPSLFDEIVESSRVRIRKPDSRIYELTLRLLGVRPSESLFLDDLQTNVAAAERHGLRTIKVTSLEQTLNDLQKTLGVQLVEVP